MKQSLLILIALLFLELPKVHSQDITVTASETNPEIDERVRVTFKLESSGNERIDNLKIRMPQSSNFKILNQGESSGMYSQIINGRMSTVQTKEYTIIIQPLQLGELTIPSIEFFNNVKTYQSKPLTLKVKKAGPKPKIPENTNILAKILLDKKQVYVGEKVTATYKVYTRYQNLRLAESKMPAYDGFWSEEFQIEQKEKIETINGINYKVITFKKDILYPQRAGRIKLEPMVLDFVIPSFGFRNQRESITSNIPILNVLPLPVPKPEYFLGAVGEYQLMVSLDKQQSTTNDPLNLKITISGKGNLKLIEHLKINLPTDFETYEPKITDKIKLNNSGYLGSRTFEYLIIPRTAGKYTLNPIKFTYFNPKTKQYKTLDSEAHKLHIKKGENESVDESGIYTNKQEVVKLNEDIRHIKSRVNLREKDRYFTSSLLYWILLIIPLLSIPLSFFLKRSKENSESINFKRKKAGKTALNELNQSFKKSRAGNDLDYYDSAIKTLYKYLERKLQINQSELNKNNVKELLEKRGLSANDIQILFSILDRAEMARFASLSSSSAEQIHEDSILIIKKIEEELK